jgi:hypothetical protein
MGFDFVLIVLILGGLALSGAYVRAEYLAWREHGAAQRRREAALRDLHAASISDQRDALHPTLLKLQGFDESEAANPGVSGEFAAARRASGSGSSARTYPLGERRKRARRRANR